MEHSQQSRPIAPPPAPGFAGHFPAFALIDRWCEISGMSRRITYEEIAAGNLHAVKRGASTLVDVQRGLAWLGSLPPAVIRPRAGNKRAA